MDLFDFVNCYCDNQVSLPFALIPLFSCSCFTENFESEVRFIHKLYRKFKATKIIHIYNLIRPGKRFFCIYIVFSNSFETFSQFIVLVVLNIVLWDDTMRKSRTSLKDIFKKTSEQVDFYF